MSDDVAAGQAVYSPFVLGFYDFVVHGLSNTWLWRCPTGALTALYDRNVSAVHLDVGVGTGLLLDRARWPVTQPSITLVDLNANSLAAAGRRIERYRPQLVAANVFDPLPVELRFRSIGLCYLLHCLPGAMAEKAPVVFRHLAEVLEPGGRIFGATIVQGDAPRTLAAQALMDFYCRRGIFSNRNDTAAALEAALAARFDKVELEHRGTVVLFQARGR